MRLPRSVSWWALAAFGLGLLWFLCQVCLNGVLIHAYLEDGQIGMTWIVFLTYGILALALVGGPATLCGLMAVIDARVRRPSSLDLTLRWVGLLMALTGPVEGLVVFVYFLPSMF